MHRFGTIALYVLVFTGALAVAAACNAQTPPTTQALIQKDMSKWWNDLQLSEPESTQALLNFSDHPVETIAFFKEHLKPLKIDQAALDGLIEMLGSDDASIWKPAFEKLSYFDPRLNVNLKKLIDDNDDPLTRGRLVAVMSDYPVEMFKDSQLKDVNLRETGNGSFNFFAGQGSWWAESKVANLDSQMGWNHKKQWTRADRAIVLLQHFGTPDAIAILQEMATGHPEARPTVIARNALKSLGASAR